MEGRTWSLKAKLPLKVVSSLNLTTSSVAFSSSCPAIVSSSVAAAAVVKLLKGEIPPLAGQEFELESMYPAPNVTNVYGFDR